ncbi:putative protease Do-like 14 [Rhododendron vialii]|uniref:putative protease Do-like 14 n=1 Tax=Rhododendron vialii TaxID=182163 RepID=UPI00265ED823|nr:putative protease Do-like 14 [Rhododendron vialii]
MEIDSVSPWKRKSRGALKASDIDIDTKRAALKASPSVVSVVSYKGGKMMLPGSGTIIDCEDVNGMYTSTILTSTTLLRSSPESNTVQDDMKVNVYLADGKSFEGHVSAHDFYFNIATISITSDVALPTACLRLLDDSISLYPSDCKSNYFKLGPGDIVVAIGRSCDKTHELMVTPGKFSPESWEFGCGELFKSSCIISKSGFGGPLINRYGEVIGVNFYDEFCTPFLPVNIVSKCLRRFRENRESCQPCLGMELTNLYAASIGKLEKVISKFSTSKGVLVDEVIKGSPAEQAGILYGDVIVQCGKKEVQSFLEFYDIIWEKVRETMEVVVIRESSAARLILEVFVDETSSDKVNRWPVPKTYEASVKRIRHG